MHKMRSILLQKTIKYILQLKIIIIFFIKNKTELFGRFYNDFLCKICVYRL